MSLADRIAIMNEGVLQQVGTPTRSTAIPANLFVAQFVGSPVMNVVDGSGRATATAARAWCSGDGRCGFALPRRALPQRRPSSGTPRTSSRSAFGPRRCWWRTQPTDGLHPGRRRTSSSRSAPTTSSISSSATQLLRARTASGFVAQAGRQRSGRSLDEAQTHFFDAATGESLQHQAVS